MAGVLAVALIILLCGGATYAYQSMFSAPDYAGSGYGSVIIQVKTNQTVTDIAVTLYDKGVVKSTKAFIQSGVANPRSSGIEVGFYRLHRQMKADLALNMLLARNSDGSLANRVTDRVTVTEGMISLDIYAKLAKATGLPAADFKKAAQDPEALGVPASWFKRTDGKKISNPPSIEGFLYPATYDFNPGETAADILKTMVHQFLTVTNGMDFAANVAKNLKISPYEALVAASIAQAEAQFPRDMGGVSRVLYNRAYGGNFPCGCLGLDSEVNYWLRISGQEARDSGNLTYSQLHDPKDPYNTHDEAGLPIGPISNPGKDALAGAMNPPHNQNVYFLTIDKQGHMAFATTNEQFCADVNTAIKNGVSLDPC